MHLRVLITVLGAISALLGSTAAQAASVVTCGQVVTTSISLANDLTNCPGGGLIIGAADITLDLNGHTIDGTSLNIGILVVGHDRVTIRNGTVRDFANGIHFQSSEGSTVGNMESSANRFAGVHLSLSDRNLLANNRLIGNSSTGVFADASDANVFVSNTAADSGFDGFFLAATSERNTMLSNVSTRSRRFGFFITGPLVGPSAQHNLLVGNVASENGADGILVLGLFNTLRANTATGNAGFGIFANPGNVDGGRNRASGNGNPAQCLGVSCASGER